MYFRIKLNKILYLIFILSAGCAPSPSALPLTEGFPQPPITSTMYAGEGRAYQYSEGKWVELPSYNYEFTVLQRRYKDGWETIKTIHRRHPLYDGRAGDRDQTLYFRISFSEVSDRKITFSAQSSIGQGTGYADPEFRNIKAELRPEGISSFAPFNTYRITQSYISEEGKLKETVEIFKKKNGSEKPFMKMEEEAMIYMPEKPSQAPLKAD